MRHREVISNTVENISFRLAERNSGIITPFNVLPYLPVSLGLVTDILYEAAAESDAIRAKKVDGIQHFEFNIPPTAKPDNTSLRVTRCVSCDQDVRIGQDDILCDECSAALETALREEAETNGWPAQAVYEHEIAYLAARLPVPIPAEQLASHSRYTVRRMRRKLEQMRESAFLSATKEGYSFRPPPYPRERYQRNMQFIRTLPASVTEDVEVRVVHILIAVGALFLLMLGLAFYAIPFPLLVLGFLIAAPVTAVLIWKHRSKLDSKEVE